MGLDRAQYDYHHWTGLMILMCVFFQFDLDFFSIWYLIFIYIEILELSVRVKITSYFLFQLAQVKAVSYWA